MSRPLQVVHVIARLNEGGPARVLAGLLPALRELDISCTVLTGRCASHEVDRRDLLVAAGAQVIDIPGLGASVRPGDDLAAFFRVGRQLTALAPDLVHTHTTKAGALGRIAARLRGLPCLHTYHGHVLYGYFPTGVNALLAAVERRLAGNAWHQALTRSQWRELFGRAGIGRGARWQVLPVPVPPITPQPGPPRDKPVIGWLGRLVPIKDGDLWLAMFARLCQTMDCQGIICGDGPERARLEQQAAGLPVRFTGMIPAAVALGSMDVLVMTSKNEGQPLSAVEAAGAGIPVVATAVGGLRDLGRSGLAQVVARDPEALAKAVRRALAMSTAQRERARLAALTLTPQALAPRYADLYHRIVACS